MTYVYTYIYNHTYTHTHTLHSAPPLPRTVYLAGFSWSRLRSAYSPLLKPRCMNMLSKSCSFLIYRFIVPRATPPRPRPPLSFFGWFLICTRHKSSAPPVYAVSLYKFRYLLRRTNCSSCYIPAWHLGIRWSIRYRGAYARNNRSFGNTIFVRMAKVKWSGNAMLMDVKQFKKIKVFFKWLNFSLPVWKGSWSIRAFETDRKSFDRGWTELW